jgi:hypothetical protein
MLAASVSIQGQLSIGCPRRGFGSTFEIYECWRAIAWPVLLLFAYIAAFRPKEVRSSYYS